MRAQRHQKKLWLESYRITAKGRRVNIGALLTSGMSSLEKSMDLCTHLNQISITSTETHVCPECVKMGDRWVHLRLCLECGHVGCCDSSKNKHATKHFHRSKHPLIRSIEPGEAWVWCYVDETEPGELIGDKLVPLAG